MATVLFLHPNPKPNSTASLQPPPLAIPRELRVRLHSGRWRTHLPAASVRGSPAPAAEGRGKDHYATLNLRRDATLQEIKSAYRTLARKYHPDMNKNPGAEEKFKEISAAYEILSDEEKRSLYDRFGVGLVGDYGDEDIHAQGIDPYELFNAFFGGSDELFGDSMGPGRFYYSTKVKDSKGLDIHYDLPLSFEESIIGRKQEINISRHETCDTCDGTGAKSNSCMTQCTQCRGRGRLTRTERTPFGIVSQISSCTNCGGSGKIITEHCTSCFGSGKVQVEHTIQVNIPGGIDDGFTLRITGGGSVDKRRSITGDLYIFLHVNGKQGIHREGLNLYSYVSINYTEAILGATVKVETIEGFKDLCIPPGTQPGEELKFDKLGAPDIKKPNVRGDHIFVVKVKIPKNISNMERALVEQLATLNRTEGISVPKNFRGSLRKRNRHSSRSKSSFWSSVRSLFGGDERDERGQRFASISIQAVTPQWTSCCTTYPAVPLLLKGFLVITALISLISSTSKQRLISKRCDLPVQAKEAEETW